MTNETNRTVTISAEYFAELHRMQNERNLFCEVNARLTNERDEPKEKISRIKTSDDVAFAKMRGDCDAIRKERDELKEKLDGDATANGLSPATQKLLETECKLAKAERCIEEISEIMSDGVIADCAEGTRVNNIIRDYLEQKEAK